MDADEFISRLKPVVDYGGTPAADVAEPLLKWFRVLCKRILEEPHPAVVALEQRYNPERDLNKVRRQTRVVCGLRLQDIVPTEVSTTDLYIYILHMARCSMELYGIRVFMGAGDKQLRVL